MKKIPEYMISLIGMVILMVAAVCLIITKDDLTVKMVIITGGAAIILAWILLWRIVWGIRKRTMSRRGIDPAKIYPTKP